MLPRKTAGYLVPVWGPLEYTRTLKRKARIAKDPQEKATLEKLAKASKRAAIADAVGISAFVTGCVTLGASASLAHPNVHASSHITQTTVYDGDVYSHGGNHLPAHEVVISPLHETPSVADSTTPDGFTNKTYVTPEAHIHSNHNAATALQGVGATLALAGAGTVLAGRTIPTGKAAPAA